MSVLPSSLTSINESISRRGLKSGSQSRIYKDRSMRKINLNDKVQDSAKKIFNDDQINEQLSKEMKEIQKLLEQIRPQLEQIQKKNNQKPIKEILFYLQEKIKNKNHLLTLITNENQQLKSANKKGITLHDSSFNPQKQSNIFKLAQQLQTQKQQLIHIKNLHLQKSHQLEIIKSQISKLQTEYFQRCKKTKQKPMTYEMFKCLNEEKKRQLNNQLRIQEKRKSKRQTLQQMLKSNTFQGSGNKQKGEKNLKQIVNRKKIAEQALKTARKKYNQEISQFYAKLEFLREQDLALVQTMRQKEVEYYTLENKFNQSRRHLVGNRTSNHNLLRSQNTIRYKVDSEDSQQKRKTIKNMRYLSPDQI